eukprot:scaffold13656_cov147-Amphora_coffeaeformis.AAC.4
MTTLTQRKIVLYEFFSGVGGMRMSVESAIRPIGGNGTEKSCFCLAACHAFEIAANANAIYRHNFAKDQAPHFTLTEQQIERLTSLPRICDDNDDSQVDVLWTLSPPCQPFTHKPGASHLDIQDTRCRGLQDGVLRLLQEAVHQPRWILLENVKGFADSTMCRLWQDTLTQCDYTWKEYLLSPTQLGIPNHRMRYYLIAEHSQRFASKMERIIHTTFPQCNAMPPPASARPLSEYIDTNADVDLRLRVPDTVWEKPWAHELDIVDETSMETHCFTSSYGRLYHPASGSLLRRTSSNGDSSFVRRFSPIEVARLLHFDASFAVPDDLKLERQYKHVANAVNVAAVACLVEELIYPPP